MYKRQEGKPLYILGTLFGQKPNLNIDPEYAQTPAGLMNRIQNVLMPGVDNSKYAMPTEVVNLNIAKDAHLTLVFAAELAGWRNAIGYYYYDTFTVSTTFDNDGNEVVSGVW